MNIDLKALGRCHVLSVLPEDFSGSRCLQDVLIESFWMKHPVVITFFCRLGCEICRQAAQEIDILTKQLSSHNIDSVGIGLGDISNWKEFLELHIFNGKLCLDEFKEVYSRLGYSKGFFDNLCSCCKGKSKSAVNETEIHKGGTIVVKKGGEHVLLNFKHGNPNSHLNNANILRVLNIQNNRLLTEVKNPAIHSQNQEIPTNGEDKEVIAHPPDIPNPLDNPGPPDIPNPLDVPDPPDIPSPNDVEDPEDIEDPTNEYPQNDEQLDLTGGKHLHPHKKKHNPKFGALHGNFNPLHNKTNQVHPILNKNPMEVNISPSTLHPGHHKEVHHQENVTKVHHKGSNDNSYTSHQSLESNQHQSPPTDEKLIEGAQVQSLINNDEGNITEKDMEQDMKKLRHNLEPGKEHRKVSKVHPHTDKGHALEDTTDPKETEHHKGDKVIKNKNKRNSSVGGNDVKPIKIHPHVNKDHPKVDTSDPDITEHHKGGKTHTKTHKRYSDVNENGVNETKVHLYTSKGHKKDDKDNHGHSKRKSEAEGGEHHLNAAKVHHLKDHKNEMEDNEEIGAKVMEKVKHHPETDKEHPKITKGHQKDANHDVKETLLHSNPITDHSAEINRDRPKLLRNTIEQDLKDDKSNPIDEFNKMQPMANPNDLGENRNEMTVVLPYHLSESNPFEANINEVGLINIEDFTQHEEHHSKVPTNRHHSNEENHHPHQSHGHRHHPNKTQDQHRSNDSKDLNINDQSNVDRKKSSFNDHVTSVSQFVKHVTTVTETPGIAPGTSILVGKDDPEVLHNDPKVLEAQP